MSRCFPYPPPGYTLRKASYEALIESIKLQKEREKAKADRKKEKKREKDERKKSKKEKSKPNTADCNSNGGKNCESSKDSIFQKERNDTEQLERSSITEEQELVQNPSYSSDSTQNSNKRKRHASTNGILVEAASLASNGTRVQGNILRIRLPSQKSINCDIGGGESISTSVRREMPDAIASTSEPDKTCNASVATQGADQSLPLGPDNELRQQHSQQAPIYSQEGMSNVGRVSKRFKKMQRAAQKYSELIENWTPPSQQLQYLDADDQDWLFGKKQERKKIHPGKTNGIDKQMSCSASALMCPSAQYLPDADIYALPYTLPF